MAKKKKETSNHISVGGFSSDTKAKYEFVPNKNKKTFDEIETQARQYLNRVYGENIPEEVSLPLIKAFIAGNQS